MGKGQWVICLFHIADRYILEYYIVYLIQIIDKKIMQIIIYFWGEWMVYVGMWHASQVNERGKKKWER
jgi:hypothetical protein